MIAYFRLRAQRATRSCALLLVLIAAIGAIPTPAFAGGLYLMPRGVRGSARGGATVAGSRTPHALWYNPAGLLASERQLLIDVTTPIFRSSFTRLLDNGNLEPKVASTSVLPIPTLAYSDDFGLPDWGFGVGLIVPPGSGASWPEEVNGRPAPQRYSILNSEGSFIASLALGAAYRPIDDLVFGIALYLTSAQVGGAVAFSACEYVTCTQPEAIEWQGKTKFLLGPVLTGTAVFGASYKIDMVTIGASVQLKTKMSGDASIDLALPDSAIFDDIHPQNADGGDDLKAGMEMVMPTVLRLGVEVQPIEPLQVELAASLERWSAQDEISIKPRNVVARDVPGIGDITAEPVAFALNMRDTWSIGLGGTYDLTRLTPRKRSASLHFGAMYESGAFSDAYMSPTSLDTQKMLLGLGATIAVSRNVFIDAVYGHIFMKNRDIKDSKVLLPAAIKPVPTDDDPSVYEVGDRPAIGNGKYTMETDFLGVALRWTLDPYKRAPKRQFKFEPAEKLEAEIAEEALEPTPEAPSEKPDPRLHDPVITPIGGEESESTPPAGGSEEADEQKPEGEKVTPEQKPEDTKAPPEQKPEDAKPAPEQKPATEASPPKGATD